MRENSLKTVIIECRINQINMRIEVRIKEGDLVQLKFFHAFDFSHEPRFVPPLRPFENLLHLIK